MKFCFGPGHHCVGPGHHCVGQEQHIRAIQDLKMCDSCVTERWQARRPRSPNKLLKKYLHIESRFKNHVLRIAIRLSGCSPRPPPNIQMIYLKPTSSTN